jgi:hypothetical protein
VLLSSVQGSSSAAAVQQAWVLQAWVLGAQLTEPLGGWAAEPCVGRKILKGALPGQLMNSV